MLDEDRDKFIQWLLLIPGLGRAKIDRLIAAGYTSVGLLKRASVEDLTKVEGIGTALSKRIKEFVDQLSVDRDLIQFCTTCGAIINEEQVKCDVCGRDLKAPPEPETDDFWHKEKPSISLCPNCGALVSEKADRCVVCGAVFEEPAEGDEEPAAGEPGKREPEEVKHEKKADGVDGHWYKEEAKLSICPNCGAIVAEDDTRCKICGIEFEEGLEETVTPAEVAKATAPGPPPEAADERPEAPRPSEVPFLSLCPTCGAMVSEKAERCLICGADLKAKREAPVEAARAVPEPKVSKEGGAKEPWPGETSSLSMCPSCGAFVSEGAEECSICGAVFEEEEEEPEKAPPKPEPAPRPKRPETRPPEEPGPAVTLPEPEAPRPRKAEEEPAKPAPAAPPKVPEAEGAPAVPPIDRKKGVTKDFLKRWERVKEPGFEFAPEELEAPKPGPAKPVEDPEELKRKAYALAKAGKYADAVEAMERLQSLRPMKEDEYKLEILNVLRTREDVPVITPGEKGERARIENALHHYERLLEIDPALEQAWQTRGELLARLGKREESLRSFGKAKEARLERETAKKLAALSALKTVGAFETRPSRFVVKTALDRKSQAITNGRSLVNGKGHMNGLINGFANGRINGMINGRGRINGLINGLIDGSGLINGDGMVNGRGVIYIPKMKRAGEPTGRFVGIIAAILTLLLVVPVLSNMMYQAPEVHEITIDGLFEDWAGIDGYVDNLTDAPGNGNIDITSYKVHREDSLLSVYAMMNGAAFRGMNEVDSLFAFVDSDADSSTGYEINGIGADYVAVIHGWNLRIEKSDLMEFARGSDRDNWSAFHNIGNVRAAARDYEVEIQFELGVGYEDSRVVLYSVDGLLNSDSSDAVVTSEFGALTVREETVAPEVVTSTRFPLLRLELENHGRDVRLTGLDVAKEGNLRDSSLNLFLYSDSNGNGAFDVSDALVGFSGVSGSNASFEMDEAVISEREMYLVADVTPQSAPRSLGARITGVKADATVSISQGHMTNVYLGEPKEVVVDGAFADWKAVAPNPDMDGDVAIPLAPHLVNENVDIADYRMNVTSSDASFYLRVDGRMLGGIDVPVIGTRTMPVSNITDSDRDTVPDQYDLNIYDFNNDGIPDEATGNDADGDGEPDYPFGDDYWLNTTIPLDFVEPYRNQTVIVYIGPVGVTIVKGLDQVQVLVDSDDDMMTGLRTYTPNGSFGFDYLILVSGRDESIVSSDLYAYNGTSNVPWDYVESVGSMRDTNELEASVPTSRLNLSSNYSFVFRVIDWWLRSDTNDNHIGTKGLTEGTRSPAGDNVVINEISSIGSPEWIELCNPTASAISLSNWYFQRKQGGGWVTIYTFAPGSSIGAWGSGGEYLTVDLSGQLPDTGTDVRLMNSAGVEVDVSKYPRLNSGQTWARYKDASTGKPVDTDSKGDWYISNSPTKGGPNDLTRPSIVVVKEADKTEASPGETVVYTIRYDNSGAGNAKKVWINDTLPNYVAYQSASEPYQSFSGRTYRWYFTDVTPGTHSFTITVRVNDSTPDVTALDNNVQLNFTDQLDAAQTGSTDSVSTVSRRPNITVVKVADLAVAAPGDRITYTIYYNNTGTGTAGYVWINDTLPNYVTFVRARPNPASIEGRTLRWIFTNVAPGSHSLTIDVDVNATAPTGNLTNEACLNYTSAGGVGMGNSCDTAVTYVPEYQDAALPVFGILLLFLALRRNALRKRGVKREDG